MSAEVDLGHHEVATVDQEYVGSGINALGTASTDLGLVIAVFAQSDQIGGAERSVIELAAADQARGARWLVLARDTGDGPISELCATHNIHLIKICGAAEAGRIIRRENASVVLVFGLRWSTSLRWRSRAGLLRGKHCRRPLFLVAQRGLDTWRKPWHNFVDWSTQRLVDGYVPNSVAAADMLINKVHINRDRVFIIRSGISTEWFAAKRQIQRLPGSITRVMIVGSNRVEKAHFDALKILACLTDKAWAATIYTNDPGRLPQQIRTLDLQDKVTVVLGHRLTVDDYDRADILLHVSHAESFPRAVLEAVARKLAVVATDVGDVAALVPSRALFAPGDIQAGARALEQAIKTPKLRQPVPPPPSQDQVAREFRGLIGRLR